MTAPCALTFEGAEVLRPEGFDRAPLSVAEGSVVANRQARVVDLTGCRILPGIVDLHGDGFERHLAPRRGLVTDLEPGLYALDVELAACGITTAVLAQFWSWEGGMRGPDFARRLTVALTRARPHLRTDIHLQLRLETHMVDDFDAVALLIESAGIGYVAFNDHLPHDALSRDKRPPRLTGQAIKSGRSPEAHLALMQRLHARGPEVPDRLAALASRLRAGGVRIASHDDSSAEERAAMRAMGAAIAEFPETPAATAAAHNAGDTVLLGAPNVVRGGSHKGMMSALEVVRAGQCDALVSDYHYPAQVQAAARLMDDGMAAAEAWALISRRPADVMGWHDRGALVPGQRADLLVTGPSGRIEATLSGGRIGFCAGEVAARLMG